MKKWLTRLLFDWIYVLLFRLFQGLLTLVDFIEGIFDVFAGISKVSYNGQKDYLINVFFGQNIIAVIFWGMTAISLVLCFVFTIVAVTRKILDMGNGIRQSLGQILNGALRSCVSFLFVSIICIASINLANICLIQVNYLMKNASTLLYDGDNVKKFTEEENAAMTRIMNTIANYSVNSSTDNRYNINVCFNSIREDMLYLQQQQFFSYEYPLADGHHTWQSAIALIASAGDIGQDLELETVDSSVAEAISTVMDEIKYNLNFRPLETASRPDQGDISVAGTIFLVSSMEAANSSVYRNNPSFDDALRRSYLNGSKSYMNLKQVRKDFDIWEVRYDVGYIACLVFIVILAQCIFLFIIRLFDLLLLYLAAPAFASSIPLDDGVRFQAWRQAFTIKVISGFGSVMAMRLYLVMIQILMDGKLRFFENNATNYLCQLLFILGGSYAVLKASPLLTQLVAGNGAAAANSEGLSAALGGIVGHRLLQTAGLGLKAGKMGVQAGAAAAMLPGKAFRGIQRQRAQRAGRAAARKMSNSALGIGGSPAGSGTGGSDGGSSADGGGSAGSGNAAQLQAPQSRGGAGGGAGHGSGSAGGGPGRGPGNAGGGTGRGSGGARPEAGNQFTHSGAHPQGRGGAASGEEAKSADSDSGGMANAVKEEAVPAGRGRANTRANTDRAGFRGNSESRRNQRWKMLGKKPLPRNANNAQRTGTRSREKK